MFEKIIEKSPRLEGVLVDALDAVKNVSEPYKSKILAGLKALDSLGLEMQAYKDIDSMMEDAASALTALTGVDVRKQGICPALSLAVKCGNPSQVADAISYAIKWHVADYLKLRSGYEQ